MNYLSKTLSIADLKKGSIAPLLSASIAIAGGLLLLMLLAIAHLAQGEIEIDLLTVLGAVFAPDGSPNAQIVRSLRLPRSAIAVMTGAAWGMAGVLFQTVTRNPLSSAATLGINAGAYFSVTAALIFVPQWFDRSPVGVALAGGILAAALVYAIAAGVHLSPLRLTLSGVAVSLALASLTAILQVFYENQLSGIFLWGAGSLRQTDWSNAAYAAPRIAIPATFALLLSKNWDILLLGDDVARSLGQNLQKTRMICTAIAVFLAALSVSVVGPIGFIGIVAPHLVRLMGCRSHWTLLPAAAIWGAIVLVGADICALQFSAGFGEIPVGTTIPLVGAPFLIWLVGKNERLDRGSSPARSSSHQGRSYPYPALTLAAIGLIFVAAIASLSLGTLSSSPGKFLALIAGNASELYTWVVFELRLPRLVVSLLAGSSLAVSGLLLQSVVRNPIAGPEIVGITSGAGLGVCFVLVLFPGASVEAVAIAAFVGAFAVFALVGAIAWRSNLSPTRLALVGIAVSAFCTAGINLLVVVAQLRVARALVWLAGSTYARNWEDIARLSPWPLVLLPLAWVFAPWLDLMALGEDLPRLLGVQLQKARALAIAIAVALAAAAVSTVGTISFVGLVAPHIARLLVGSRHRQLVPLAALFGALLVAVADTLGRIVVAPAEIPSGLVTAAIGTPYFLWLLWRSR